MDSLRLNSIYHAYHDHPTEQTINDLFAACRQYASQIAATYRRDDVEDVAQDIVVRAWANLDRFRGRSSFATWFRHISTSHLNDLYHRDKLHSLSHGDLPEDADDRLPPPELYVGPTKALGDLSQLTPDQREVLTVLVDTGDFQETADRLGITLKALHRRLDRIKAKCAPAS